MIAWQPIDALAAWVRELDVAPEPPSLHRHGPLRGYAQLWFELVSALTRSSDRVTVATVGSSVGGEPLWAIAVDPGGASPRCTTLVIAGLHAMEHIGCAAAAKLLVRAAADATLWGEHRLVVMPVVNADGFRSVCADLDRGRRAFRRANLRGVDLNRNFSCHFGASAVLGRLLGRRFFEPGPRPLSEPESMAVAAVLSAEAPAFAVSLHAFGRWIYLPWAGSRARSPRAGELEVTAQQMISAQPRPYRVAVLGQRSRLFLAGGTEIDHFHAAGALSFLIEIGPGPGLADPGGWLRPYAWYTPQREAAEHEIRNVIPAVEALGRRRPG